MKLASIDNKTRDGQLVIVDKQLTSVRPVPEIARTLQQALDEWDEVVNQLEAVSASLNAGQEKSIFKFNDVRFLAPLPRAYHWADGSAYVTHVELVRKARNATLPPSFWTEPLIYMGASDAFIGPNDDIEVENEEWGIDFESEVAVITNDVPAGTDAKRALNNIRLITILNDITLRNLVPGEIAKQFGFYQSKPWTSFAPIAATPDEFGDSWDKGKLHLPLISTLNGKVVGSPNAGVDMTFDFGELIAHACRTRSLMAGTIIGSGTVANQGSGDGSSCLAEIRSLEIIDNGKAETPFMSFGDRIEIELKDLKGHSILGKINQVVKKYYKP